MKIEINKEGMLSNLARTFSNKNTFVTELLQNARRAGATKVEISQSGNLLVIDDNGNGITDWESLLIVGQSGWNPESTEKPYGLGFFSAIFTAEAVSVISNGQAIAFEPKAVLGGAEIYLQPMYELDNGMKTRVVLQLPKPVKHVVFEIAAYSLPMKITYNTLVLSNQHALGTHKYVRIPGVGWMSKNILYLQVKKNIAMYLQGVSVGNTRGYFGYNDNYNTTLDHCIHLDNKFDARMPDRDRLINERDVIQVIKAGILKVKVAWLREMLTQCHLFRSTYEAHKLFVSKYHKHIEGWFPSYYYDKDWYTMLVAGRYNTPEITDYPTMYPKYENQQTNPWANPCEVTAYKFKPSVHIDFDSAEPDFAPLMWLREVQDAEDIDLPVYNIYPPGSVQLGYDCFAVTTEGQIQNKSDFHTDVVIAEKIFIELDKGLFMDSFGGWDNEYPEELECLFGRKFEIDRTFYQDGVIYVPMCDEWPESVVDQVEDFFDEATNNFSPDREEWQQDFKTWVDYQKSGDESGYLLRYLSVNGSLPSKYEDCEAVIKIGKYGRLLTIEVRESDLTPLLITVNENVVKEATVCANGVDLEKQFTTVCRDYGVEPVDSNFDDGFMELEDNISVCMAWAGIPCQVKSEEDTE